MAEVNEMRLSLAAKKLNKGIDILVKVLESKDYRIDNNPNYKLNFEQLQFLSEHFNNQSLLLNPNEPQNTLDELQKKIQSLKVIGSINLDFNPKLYKPNIMESPIQKILFGSPGTGKSFKVEAEYLKNLKIEAKENCIKTVFHPEYTYGDFIGKLLPRTIEGSIRYDYYEGDFLKALSQAYINIIENGGKAIGAKNVILVIDEINRGNSAAIFGTIFQLLDRDSDGYSSYSVKISKMEFERFIELVFPNLRSQTSSEAKDLVEEMNEIYKENKSAEKKKKLDNLLSVFKESNYEVKKKEEIEKFVDEQIEGCFLNQEIKLPPNLSIIGTMNTSDNSIYYMDSAFKRRWDWEYIDIKNEDSDEKLNSKKDDKLKDKKINIGDNPYLWTRFVDHLNDFLKSQNASIRKIEDKQIGYYFIKGETISKDAVKNKLMFFLWDSVFTNNKNPLIKLLKTNEKDLITFGDFVKNVDTFCKAIIDRSWEKNV